MSSNIQVTFKRHNGTDYDVLFPTTIVEQITELSSSKTLATLLGERIASSEKGSASGVATLGSDQKLTSSQVPSYLLTGGPFQAGTFGTAFNLSTFYTALTTDLTPADITTRYGWYYQCTAETTVSWSNGTPAMVNYTVSPGDEGDTTSPITLEAGDLIVFTKYEYVDPNGVYTFAIINNTTGVASSTAYGIVQLSAATDTSAMNGSAKVITEDVLYDIIGTAANKLAAGNHNHDGVYATSGHNHSGVYQPVDATLTGLAALSWSSGTPLVRMNGADSFTLDTATYLTTQSYDFHTITVTDTDSGYSWADTGTVTGDGVGDGVVFVSGTSIEVDADSTNTAVRFSHADTSTLSGAQGTAGIASITVDGLGHVTAVTTATYNNYSLPLAASGTRGGLQIGYTSTETNRALLLSSEMGYISLPRQIPADTLNGSSTTSPTWYAPTASGTAGSTTVPRQGLNSGGSGVAPSWINMPLIHYDTATSPCSGDIWIDID